MEQGASIARRSLGEGWGAWSKGHGARGKKSFILYENHNLLLYPFNVRLTVRTG
jgi:hypothetical protein